MYGAAPWMKNQKKGSGPVAGGQPQDSKWILKIDWSHFLGKWCLLPYAAPNGQFLQTAEKNTMRPTKFFTEETILKHITPVMSEWAKRLKFAMSFAAGAMSSAGEELQVLPENHDNEGGNKKHCGRTK